MGKNTLRLDCLKARQDFVDSLTAVDRTRLQTNLLKNLQKVLSPQPGDVVAGYWPMSAEQDPRPYLNTLLSEGIQVCLPVVAPETSILIFRQWEVEVPLVRQPDGFMAPQKAAPSCVPNILLVPLVAFDEARHRLGYGRGHYDRTLAALREEKKILAVGIGFEVQKVASLPIDDYDQALDFIVTEDAIL